MASSDVLGWDLSGMERFRGSRGGWVVGSGWGLMVVGGFVSQDDERGSTAGLD